MGIPCILIDLDGTLCNIDHRIPFLKTNRKEFFKGISNDSINNTVSSAILDFFYSARDIVFVSGRPKSHKQESIAWLEQNFKFDPGLVRSPIYMRANSDSRPDHEVKKDLLKDIREDGYDPLFVIDDRDSVVEMWLEEGLDVFHYKNPKSIKLRKECGVE